MDLRDLLATPDTLDPLAATETMEPPVPLDPKDPPAQLVNQETTEPQERLDAPPSANPSSPETRDHPESPELWVFPASQEQPVPMDSQATLDQKDPPDPLEPQELLEKMAKLDLRDPLDNKENAVSARNIAPSTEEFSSKTELAVKHQELRPKCLSISLCTTYSVLALLPFVYGSQSTGFRYGFSLQ